eukprot:TRINITY_DN2693_c0_g1_i1.p2 TRINITY_DN2693_c0_g1~~TRINITY_DN2693_c0_g1_i1.p2  ORF type:complete len:88 (+),score=18.09 TRINITY_DN2693_c0_g1_i1:153-416(+)
MEFLVPDFEMCDFDMGDNTFRLLVSSVAMYVAHATGAEVSSLNTLMSYVWKLFPLESRCPILLSLFRSHVLCVDTGRSSETAKAHRG